MFVLILDIIISLVFILVYYLVFVSPKKNASLVYDVSHKNHYGGPFAMHFDKNEIRAAGRTWHVPIDPNLYTWTSGGSAVLKPVHPCDKKPDGSLVKVNDIATLPPNTVPAVLSSLNLSSSPNYHDFAIDYYFECKKNGKSVLYHCPPGTHFVKGKCTSTEICHVKPDGFKYPIAGRETQYFECRNRTAVRKDCSPGEIFAGTECHKPRDPCHLKPDGHILGYDRSSFKICRRKVTNVHYCSDDEYFHPTALKCVPKICENVRDDVVARDQITDKIWKYSPGYAVCKNGLVVAEKYCCGQEQHATLNEEMELPRFKVYDPQTKQCSVPRLCGNIFPSKISVPATKYTRSMANYKHSPLYDKLHGYKCDSSANNNNNAILHVPPPGQLFDGSSVCDDKTFGKYPVYGHWHEFYDCASRRKVQLASSLTTYDHDKQTNVYTGDSFHKMDNGHPIFKFDDLYHDWIAPRTVRKRDTAKCTGSQIHDVTYDICVDPECRNLGFLRQIPGSKIILNDDHVCSNSHKQQQQQTIRYEPYRKPKGLKLDYWRQKFIDANQAIPPCAENTTRLETPDFVMNATVYPTCMASQPFILCPSSRTEKITRVPYILDPPVVCVPQTTELAIKPHVWYTVYNSQTAHVKFSEDDTTLELRNGNRFLWANKGKNCILANYAYSDLEINFKVDKPGVLYKTNLPTNHPEYVINEDKRIHYKAMDGLNPIDPETAKFHFVNYKFEEKLQGFDFS